MTFRVRYHPLFKADADQHIRVIESVSPPTAAKLAAAIDTALGSLEEQPLRHSFFFDDYRRVLLKRFRLLIPFKVDDGMVYVVGLVHGSRDTRKWLLRRTTPHADDE